MGDDNDLKYMQECLSLAIKAEGRTKPNPLVGAVVLNAEGQVVGRGFHRAAGQAHAEVVALDEAGEAARGGTLYVNLEPCCHQGKTPPCVQRVLAAGLKRVVIGMVDPNPKVSGGGIAALKDQGLEIAPNVLQDECRWLNRAFIKHQIRGLPWVCLKLASTLDAKIADHRGTSRWISGPEARHYVHELRDKYDCVMVGGATAVKDDPQLNVRDLPGSRDPIRAVIDTDLLVSPEAKVCQEDTGGPTIIFCSTKALRARGKRYPEHVRLVGLETTSAISDQLDLPSALEWLAEHDILSVLVEGGSRLSGGLLKKGLIDELQWIIAPKILGDFDAIPAIAGIGRVKLEDAWQLARVTTKQLGAEILVSGVIGAPPWEQ